MLQVKQGDDRLPIQRPPRDALIIYAKRLGIFSAITLANILLLGYVSLTAKLTGVYLLAINVVLIAVIAMVALTLTRLPALEARLHLPGAGMKLEKDVFLDYQVGMRVTGKVSGIVEYGALIELESGVSGFIPHREITWGNILDVSKVINIGDQVTALILEVDREKRQLQLSLRLPENNPLLEYRVGEHVLATITGIMSYGLIVEIEPGLHGLVHASKLSQKYRIDIPEHFYIGQEIDVLILAIDIDERRISLSMKQA